MNESSTQWTPFTENSIKIPQKKGQKAKMSKLSIDLKCDFDQIDTLQEQCNFLRSIVLNAERFSEAHNKPFMECWTLIIKIVPLEMMKKASPQRYPPHLNTMVQHLRQLWKQTKATLGCARKSELKSFPQKWPKVRFKDISCA